MTISVFKISILLGVLALGTGIAISMLYANPSVASFEECAAAGLPISESFPRTCRAGDAVFTETPEPIATDLIRVSTPFPYEPVASPFVVEGEARGNWFFEATFPVRLVDGEGNEIARTYAESRGEWMTTEFVPFRVTLGFDPPRTTTGKLILEKDNPSGLPEHAASVQIPVRFARPAAR